MDELLIYKTPASCFEEALPIGNGKIGAMIYGNPDIDKISLSEDTLWSGYNKITQCPECTPEFYKKIQRLVMENRYEDAERLVESEFNSINSQVYLPLGNIFIEAEHTNVSKYERSLDLSTAIVCVSYAHDECQYNRE